MTNSSKHPTMPLPPIKDINSVVGEYVTIEGDDFYRIQNYDALQPFFISLVSSSNHWLFISTTGGLTAGRTNAGYALFPYYTVDKLTENSENTGSKTVIRVQTDAGESLWEPFSMRYDGIYPTERNLYKNIAGTALIFEERNQALGLTFRYMWRMSTTYGFVKTSTLINHNDEPRQVTVLDGLQNILPAHVPTDVQTQLSNLLDAYKLSELHSPTGLGMFMLNSRLTDLAEPSESLRANTVWHIGLDDVGHLLSSAQVDAFRRGQDLTEETQVRGKRGAYFVRASLNLAPDETRQWHFVAEVHQDSADVVALNQTLDTPAETLITQLLDDIRANRERLKSIVGMSDGLQKSSDTLSTAHHFANVLFNVMRGGIFANQYTIDTHDLRNYVAVHRPALLQEHATFFEALPAEVALTDLHERVNTQDDSDLVRLVTSYLPLTFSRRHGDPSRPWNRFEINVKHPDGSLRLDYQGNWRDIFQNWEALSYAYPHFIDGMISTFLNATTFDGYNPYRITRDGIDWEVPEPDNAWANIGYWNDHQIIYLQKLLEVSERFFPKKLASLLQRPIFSYADVPYQIKPYSALIEDAYDTIDFDWVKEEAIQERVKQVGADGKLVHGGDGKLVYATLGEKLLLLLLTKMTNFVPEGGIWLNTQRPEWNDANNALVGKGLSVVTLGYVRRYVAFFMSLLKNSETATLNVNHDLFSLWQAIQTTLDKFQHVLAGTISDQDRRAIMDALGEAGSTYRWRFYRAGATKERENITTSDLIAFLERTQAYVEHALRANKRDDHLYHAYNILHLGDGSASISHLSLMLEGQVSILSSGLLNAEEALALLQAMPTSDIYRADQRSYMLYPNREIASFLEKNIIPTDAIKDISLVSVMLERNDRRLFLQNSAGGYHFSGDMRNAKDVANMLNVLAQEAPYADLVPKERKRILDVFEQVFHHDAFTGRSSTFFAFEGLGSIYWHMVSKLLLATEETTLKASDASPDTLNALREAYDDVRAGIGFNKSPAVYGAFPTDPYSHTPWGQGAKQPGMTGMVKEEVLTRLSEVGISIEGGAITLNTTLLRQSEWLESADIFTYVDVNDTRAEQALPTGSFGFTFCQVPFVVTKGDATQITVHTSDGKTNTTNDTRLPVEVSQHIFARDGHVVKVHVVLG
jgi:hypothetical protein